MLAFTLKAPTALWLSLFSLSVDWAHLPEIRKLLLCEWHIIPLNCEYQNKRSLWSSPFFLFLSTEYGHHYESGAPGGTGGEWFLFITLDTSVWISQNYKALSQCKTSVHYHVNRCNICEVVPDGGDIDKDKEEEEEEYVRAW